VVLLSGTASTILDEITNIELAFRQAELNSRTGRGDTVYLHVKLDGSADTFRAVVEPETVYATAGTIMYPSNMGISWERGQIKLTLVISRRNYWESTTLEVVSIHGTGSSYSTKTTIDNFLPSAAIVTDTDISFTAPDTISKSGADLSGWDTRFFVSVRGTTNNDGIYSIASATASAITVNEPVIVNESAGASISLWEIGSFVDYLDTIEGDMPTPLMVTLANTDATSNLETIWLAQMMEDGKEFPFLFDVMDSDTGSNSADASSCHGYMRTYTITTSEAKVTGWTIYQEWLTILSGSFCRVLCKFSDNTDIDNVRWKLKLLSGSTVLWVSKAIRFDDTYQTVDRYVRELKSIQLPPDRFVDGNLPSDLTLELWGVSMTGSSVSIDIDCLMILPVDGGNYKMLRSLSSLLTTEVVTDDGINNFAYKWDSGTGLIVANIVSKGNKLYVTPGRMGMVYIIETTDDNLSIVGRQTQVALQYRPRRRGL
jgi:hypothetical protein